MKRKRKLTNASSASRNTPKTSAMSPGPSSSQPDLKTQEPSENCVREDDSPVDQDRKVEASHQNMDDDHNNDQQPGPCLSPAEENNPEESSSLPLTAEPPACSQGVHHDVNAGDNIVLIETSSAENTEQVSDEIAGKLCLVPIERSESDVIWSNVTDMATNILQETTDVSGQVNGDHQTSETCDGPVMEGRCMTGVNGNGFMAEDVCEMGNSSQEPKSDLQEASQKCQALNETLDLADLPNTPEITSQSNLPDFQRVKDAPCLPDCDGKLEERDDQQCQDPPSQTQVVMSPEETPAKLTDQFLLHGVEIIPSEQTDAVSEDPRELTNGLELLDSQLLVALDETFYESGKSVENHIRDQWTSAAPRPETPQATAAPRLSVNAGAVQDTRGPQHRRTEDASSTVQGLTMELSNINRLIMSTYRELRQKRVRHTPGRGATSGKRRREM